jgi:uncharacterized protein involved in type VI secretion and phage assembly
MSPYTDSPILNIVIGEESLPSTSLEGLTGFRLQQRLSLPSLCELYFRDPPGRLDYLSGICPGLALQVWAQGSPRQLFDGDITAIEHHYLQDNQREIYLRAYDRLHRLRKRQTVRTFEDISLVNLARMLCKDLGFDQLKFTGNHLTWPLILQQNQSDLGILVELAAREGLYLVAEENDLHLVSLEGLPNPPVALVLEENLFEAHIEMNVDAASDRIAAWAWNANQVELVQAEAGTPRTGRQVPAQFSVTAAGGLAERSLVNEISPGKDHAAALAQAELDRRTASEIIFQGVSAGNPELRPGRLVDVSGVAANVAGRYVLTHTTHLIDASGYRTELDTAPPEAAPRLRTDTAAFGVVFDAADPEDHARVRVRLPAYNNTKTGWLPVAVPGAGEGKGLVALPDVGDIVLVLLLGDNSGLVLGGLYGRQKAPGSVVEPGHGGTYAWITPGKQKIQLHDKLLGGKIRIENDSGAYIELDGGHITIAGRLIDFIQT